MRARLYQNEANGRHTTRPYTVPGCVRDLCSGLLHRIVFGASVYNHSSFILSLHYFLILFCSANVHGDNADDQKS